MPTERRTATIELGVPDGPDAPGAIEAILRRELQAFAADGWEPAHDVCFDSLLEKGALEEVGTMLGGAREYASVTVQLWRNRGADGQDS